jgi:hypothetical protein
MNPHPVTLKDQVYAGFLNLLTEKIQRIESELGNVTQGAGTMEPSAGRGQATNGCYEWLK